MTRLVLVLVFAVFAFPYPESLGFMNEGNFFADTREYFALAVYVIASLTDAADGHIARKYHLITDFGKFLDPIADKLLVTAALLSLTSVSLMYLRRRSLYWRGSLWCPAFGCWRQARAS